MTKYIFWAHSLPGLLIDVELMAKNYTAARNKVLKYIAMHTELKHQLRGIRPSKWE